MKLEHLKKIPVSTCRLKGDRRNISEKTLKKMHEMNDNGATYSTIMDVLCVSRSSCEKHLSKRKVSQCEK